MPCLCLEETPLEARLRSMDPASRGIISNGGYNSGQTILSGSIHFRCPFRFRFILNRLSIIDWFRNEAPFAFLYAIDKGVVF